MRGIEPLLWILVTIAIAGLVIVVIYFDISQKTLVATKELTSQATNDLEMVKLAASACSMWRSAPVFFDPAALCPGIAEAVVTVFPTSDCSADNPVACEAACSCLLKLQKYCNLGSPGAGKSPCLDEPCRVQMEG